VERDPWHVQPEPFFFVTPVMPPELAYSRNVQAVIINSTE
jgi:hypothetical protein